MKHDYASISHNPAVTRLERLHPLSADDRAALLAGAQQRISMAARRELMKVGDPVRSPTILLAGWACRVRDLRDGRRQILDFVLPGEIVGLCQHRDPRVQASVVTLTQVVACPAPDATPGSALAEAYAVSAAHGEASLLRQITRLGRLNALERTADLFLELHERLMMSESAGPAGFSMPITQETLADVLGLTSVHVNRTLQTMRRTGLLVMTGGSVTLPDRAALHDLVEYSSVDVGGSMRPRAAANM